MTFTQTIQANIDAAYSAGGGTVSMPNGVFILDAPLILRSRVRLLGQGRHQTRLQLSPNLIGFAAIYTDGFDIANFKNMWNYRYGTISGPQITYTEADGLHNGCVIEGITIDCNARGHAKSHGICIYGGGFTIKEVGVLDCSGEGIWVQCGKPDNGWQGDANYNYANMHEATIIDVTVSNTGANGILFRGPNDSYIDRVQIKNAKLRGFSVESGSNYDAGGLKIGTVHCYSCHGDTSIAINASNVFGDQIICDTPYEDGIIISSPNNVLDKVWVLKHNRLRTSKYWGLKVFAEGNFINHYKYINDEGRPDQLPHVPQHGGALNVQSGFCSIPNGFLGGGPAGIVARGKAVIGVPTYKGFVKDWS